jgi:hypothetical protein
MGQAGEASGCEGEQKETGEVNPAAEISLYLRRMAAKPLRPSSS